MLLRLCLKLTLRHQGQGFCALGLTAPVDIELVIVDCAGVGSLENGIPSK